MLSKMAAVDVDVLRAVFRRHAVHEPLRLLHLTQKVALSSSSVAAPFPPLLGSLMTVDLALGGLGGLQSKLLRCCRRGGGTGSRVFRRRLKSQVGVEVKLFVAQPRTSPTVFRRLVLCPSSPSCPRARGIPGCRYLVGHRSKLNLFKEVFSELKDGIKVRREHQAARPVSDPRGVPPPLRMPLPRIPRPTQPPQRGPRLLPLPFPALLTTSREVRRQRPLPLCPA
jgi:hypothetical protein